MIYSSFLILLPSTDSNDFFWMSKYIRPVYDEYNSIYIWVESI